MKTILFDAERASTLKMAGKILNAGGLVAMPTETVYGLAANALDDRAIERVFRVKGRPQDNPLIVHVGKFDEIVPLVKKIPDITHKLIEQYWPGPLTLIFKKSDLLGMRVTAGLGTVAIRCPAHPAARRLIENAGCPVAAPSANLSGRPSPTTAQHVLNDLDGRIEAVVDGGSCEIGVESSILDISRETPVLLRPGGISEDDLRLFIPGLSVYEQRSASKDEDMPASPGIRHRHYAPRVPFALVEATPEKAASFIRQKAKFTPVGALCFRDESVLYDGMITIEYGKSNEPEVSCRELFEALRTVDKLPIKQLYARLPEGGKLAATLRDRLSRAAAGHILSLEDNR
ncbi:MAG: L-threonylcarbamoyladenylate synthase [Oscillospiraceae bacterium]|nr:L-threonylcarbamoyladenylate synthase [Oscillospiraceae bacterium]